MTNELNARYDPMSRDELIAECERLNRELQRMRRYLAHPDPTGKTREPPHCPSCACELAPGGSQAQPNTAAAKSGTGAASQCAHDEVALHDADKLWHCTWCDEPFTLAPAQSEPKASRIEPRVFRGNGPDCLGCGKTLPEHLTNYNFCPGLPSDDRPAVNRRAEP